MNSSEFRRVLRDDGRLLVAIPAPDDLVELRGAGRDRVERTIETFANEFAHPRSTPRDDDRRSRSRRRPRRPPLHLPAARDREESSRCASPSVSTSSSSRRAERYNPPPDVRAVFFRRHPDLQPPADAAARPRRARSAERRAGVRGDRDRRRLRRRHGERDERTRAKNYALTFRSQPNSGPGRARNHGVSLATGTLRPLHRRRHRARAALSRRARARPPRRRTTIRLTACLGYTGWPPGERVTAFMDYINDYGLQFGYKLIRDGEIVPFNFFYTSNISIDRQLLGDDPFDTTFPAAAWEDIELAFRLDALGLKIRYNAQAVTRHYHPMTVDSFARRQYTVGQSGAIFYRKHPELGRLPRRPRAGDAHARRRAPPRASPPPRPPRRTIPRAGDEPRVRDADARALPARVARWVGESRRELRADATVRIEFAEHMFITFEGIEGSGKSTQLRRAGGAHSGRGRDEGAGRNAAGRPHPRHPARQQLASRSGRGGVSVRGVAAAARRRGHPAGARRAAAIVLCDRFTDSTLAYQGFGRLIESRSTARAQRLGDRFARRPTSRCSSICRRRSASRARARATPRRSQDEGRFEAEDLRFHRRVREGYLALAAAEPKRFVGDRRRGRRRRGLRARRSRAARESRRCCDERGRGAAARHRAARRAASRHPLHGPSPRRCATSRCGIAKTLNCLNGTTGDDCTACQRIERRMHPDVHFIEVGRRAEDDQRRADPRDRRRGHAASVRRAQQGLHHRSGRRAERRRLELAAQDARGAGARHDVHPAHALARSAAADDPLALPADLRRRRGRRRTTRSPHRSWRA